MYTPVLLVHGLKLPTCPNFQSESQPLVRERTLLQRLQESSHPVAMLFFLGFRVGMF